MPVTSKPSAVQSSTPSSALPDFPEFAPGLVLVDGGQETNAAIQAWWDNMKYQLLQLQNGNQQASLKIQATAKTTNGTLTAAIQHEATVRADADSALSTDINTVSATLTTVDNTLTAAITTEATARATADGFLSANYSIKVTAGSVVTGMQLNSSTGGGVSSSTIDFQGSNFRIWDGTTAYPIFATAPGVVTLAGTLTVNTSGKVFIGAGNYAASDTAWYVDSAGNFSLKDKLTWNGSVLTINGSVTATTGTIGGWTIGATTLSNNNAVLDSAGNLLLGTTNDVVILSATDATYRIWAGNASAGSASFKVTKAGVLSATGATLSGIFSVGSGPTETYIDSVGARFGYITGGSSSTSLFIFEQRGVTNDVAFSLYDGTSTRLATWDRTGMVLSASATIEVGALTHPTSLWNIDSSGNGNFATISGSGALVTNLDASNISSGTLNTARLPSTINIATSYQMGGTEVINSSRDLVSCGIQLGFSNPVKCDLVVDTVGGADHAFANYMSISMNGVQVWVPYFGSAP